MRLGGTGRAAIATIVLATGLLRLGPKAAGQVNDPALAQGISLMRSGDFPAAERKLQEAVQANPSSIAAHYNLALVLLRLQKRTGARAELTRVTELAPQIAPAHYNLALLLEEEGKFQQAALHLEAVRKLDGSDTAALIHLVEDEFRAGAATQGVAIAKEALAQSKDPRVNAHLGIVLVENGRGADAIEPLKNVVEAAPNGTSLATYLARAYVQAGKTDRAISALSEALKQAPENAEMHFALGQLLAQSSSGADRRRACEEMKTAIRLDPAAARYYPELGRQLLEQKEVEEAETILKQGLLQAPHSADIYLMLAVAEAELHGTEIARPYIEKALAIDENAALGYNLLGNLALRLGNYEEALRNYKRALELSPRNDLYAYEAALALERLDRVNEAMPYAQKAVELKPDRGIAHYMLGKLYAKAQRDREAIRELETAIRLNPEDTEPYYALARTYRKLGDAQRADAYEAKLAQSKAGHDRRVGLSSPATEASALLWDAAR